MFGLGYLGIEKDFLRQLSSLPYRKERDQEGGLSEEEKESTKVILKKE